MLPSGFLALSGSRTHIGEDYGRAFGEFVNESIQTGWRVDVDLRYSPTEEVGQRTACFVLRVQVEELDRNLVFLELFRQAGHHARLADAALSAHRQNYALFDRPRWWFRFARRTVHRNLPRRATHRDSSPHSEGRGNGMMRQRGGLGMDCFELFRGHNLHLAVSKRPCHALRSRGADAPGENGAADSRQTNRIASTGRSRTADCRQGRGPLPWRKPPDGVSLGRAKADSPSPCDGPKHPVPRIGSSAFPRAVQTGGGGMARRVKHDGRLYK